ncbi:MarR family winged helix-turn-helix transcriptional regulator [Plantactinospora sp. GCM10030261]|uniref:MarR family winged helix-turn-helix transcriptional regulator n=1 Tax=Plantactinospora sp. GCM10030261 TaxID=3273420 RepID=UPI00361FC135
MVEQRKHEDPVAGVAAAVDGVAGGLLAVWDAARQRTTGQLSTSQLRALIVVQDHAGINLRGLAKRLGMLLSSASRLCDRLVAAGLLEREPGRVDRREIALHLTPAGEDLLGELRDDRQDQLAEVLRGMSVTGRQALLRGLSEFDAVAQTRSSGAPAPLHPRAVPDTRTTSAPTIRSA